LTQVLRVPGTFHFKDPARPFLCRLLLDNASAIAPYHLHVVRSVLDSWEVFHGIKKEATPGVPGHPGQTPTHPYQFQEKLKGVPEGQRNATAASILGGILGWLPDQLWETAGWGGLKEWNQRNSVPLPERELRAVFQNIARREQAKRQRGRQVEGSERRPELLLRFDVRISSEPGTYFSQVTGISPAPSTPS
jgi:hypothetical protein